MFIQTDSKIIWVSVFTASKEATKQQSTTSYFWRCFVPCQWPRSESTISVGNPRLPYYINGLSWCWNASTEQQEKAVLYQSWLMLNHWFALITMAKNITWWGYRKILRNWLKHIMTYLILLLHRFNSPQNDITMIWTVFLPNLITLSYLKLEPIPASTTIEAAVWLNLMMKCPYCSTWIGPDAHRCPSTTQGFGKCHYHWSRKCLILNWVEVYARIPTLDGHFERFKLTRD